MKDETTPTPPTPTDEEFQAELRTACLAEGPTILPAIRLLLHGFTENVATRDELYRKVHSITGNAGLAGLTTISRVASALELLLKELVEKPDGRTPSTQRTIAQGVDLLDQLYRAGAIVDDKVPNWFNVLHVDDEDIPRRAVDFALAKVKLKPISAKDSATALKVANERSLDLIISDIEMPGMNGLELCEKIRATGRNTQTPIVFVTAATQFENRAQAVLKGGNDLIAKPFLSSELALKALIFLLKPCIAG